MAYMQWETVVRYDCPFCRAALAWTPGAWRGWVLCPSCGKPGRPPAPRLVMPGLQPSPINTAELKPQAWDGSRSVDGDEQPRWSRELEQVRRRSTEEVRWKPIRSAASVGLASALFIMLVGYLDQNSTVSSLAAVAALIMFVVRIAIGGR
ncbi:hypothetical protein [Paludisphaera rhizosphaerae]|uniref:hypothetical protein n=1 Tax=Paludisphaera rhizosphaerae TaxID=2711216 RepID=UPI0013EA12D6|nr:hypothetical protein [Paludisphaera rhizosphaerae]